MSKKFDLKKFLNHFWCSNVELFLLRVYKSKMVYFVHMNVSHSYWVAVKKKLATVSWVTFTVIKQPVFFLIVQDAISQEHLLSLRLVPDWLPVLFLTLESDFFVPKPGMMRSDLSDLACHAFIQIFHQFQTQSSDTPLSENYYHRADSQQLRNIIL